MLKASFCLTAAAALASAPAIAQTPITVSGGPTARVSYAELNLGSPSGMEVLNGRIKRAAEEMCIDNRVRDLARDSAGRACIAQAIASAQPQIERAIANAASGQHLAAAARTVSLSLRR